MDRSVMTRMSLLLLGCLVWVGCWSVQQSANPPAASYRAQDFDVRAGQTLERVKGAAVSDAFFSGGGVLPLLGRTVLPSENGSMRVAVISYRFWSDKFHSDPAAIGRTLQVNGQNATVVGVMPRDFSFPDGAQLWVPSTLR